jgi:hypothetical protein
MIETAWTPLAFNGVLTVNTHQEPYSLMSNPMLYKQINELRATGQLCCLGTFMCQL